MATMNSNNFNINHPFMKDNSVVFNVLCLRVSLFIIIGSDSGVNDGDNFLRFEVAS